MRTDHSVLDHETSRLTRRVLLVDDEPSILFAMGDYLTARGSTVDCAHDRDEALALLARHAYGVVVADLRLNVGDRDGLEVAEYVLAHCPATRTILLTAYGSPAIEADARRCGVDVVLSKSQRLREIARIIDRLLGG